MPTQRTKVIQLPDGYSVQLFPTPYNKGVRLTIRRTMKFKATELATKDLSAADIAGIIAFLSDEHFDQ
jgi:hypothetical protein